MARKGLADNLRWEEIVEKIMADCSSEDPEFRKWLLEKESLGGFFFNSLVWGRCYSIARTINKFDQDHFTIITGPEGCGKSFLARQIASVISPTFSMKYICYEFTDFADILKTAKKGDTVLIDEGALFSFSREALKEENRKFVKIVTIMRQLNLHVIICIPNFFSLDSYIRNHRTHTLIHIPGLRLYKFRLYSRKAIDYVVKFGKVHNYHIDKVRCPSGTWFYGFWTNHKPQLNDLNIKDYEQKKLSNLHDVLSASGSSEKSSWVKTREAAESYLGISQNAVLEKINKGSIPARKIGGSWFIPRKFLEKDGNEGVETSS